MIKENKIVPKFRFPEFKDVGEWKFISGDKLFDTISNKNHNSDLPVLAITQEFGAIPRDMIDYSVSVTDKSIESYKVVEKGDFIISLRSFQGGIEYSNYKGICSPAYIILRKTNKNDVDNFFKFYFKTDLFIRDLNKNLEGIRDGKMVSYKQFSEILLPKPEPQEQQKIASCLSSLDELIAAENQKLETLKTHKKGLMQQLFPTEGETEPKLRFAEFQDNGNWNEVQFGKLIKINSGKGFKASEYSNEGIRLLQIENVGYGITKWSKDAICLPQNYALEYPELLLKKGDIVIALNRPVTNNELKMARLQKCDEPCFLYQRVGKLELLSDSLINEFIFQLCQWFVKDFVIKKSIGSDQPFISLNELYTQKFRIPLPSEQQKIASCLSSLDELIAAQSQKTEALKVHKKGLMQGLFPAMSEL